jgi:hypothetical protein
MSANGKRISKIRNQSSSKKDKIGQQSIRIGVRMSKEDDSSFLVNNEIGEAAEVPGNSRTPALDSFYLTDASHKQIIKLAKADEAAGISIGHYAQVQFGQRRKVDLVQSADDQQFSTVEMQEIRECAEYRWNMLWQQKRSADDMHREGMVIFQGQREVECDLQDPPTEITAEIKSAILNTAKDLVDSCGHVANDTVFDKTCGHLDKFGISRIDMELLATNTGINATSFEVVSDCLDQIECEQTRTIEYARLATIYKTMLLHVVRRIEALRDSEERSSRVFG